MAQRRMVYASLWQDEEFASLSDKAKLLYIGTITLADDYGRLKANSHLLRSQVFPFDEELQTEQVKSLLAEIVNAKMLKYYQVEKQWYLEHPKWFDWQILRKDRMTTSRIPSDNQVTTKRTHKISKDKIREVKLREDNTLSVNTDAFNQFWTSYPKKELKKKSQEIWVRKQLDSKLPEILSFIESAKNSDRWKKGFVKQPPVFLNGECWNDEIESYKDNGRKRVIGIIA